MRIDHVVYAAEPDGLVATAKRLGDELRTEAVDGGLHPRFGTRNVILPLQDHRFVEVVEPLDHPAAEKAPFGQVVRARTQSGGGWLGWVIELKDIRGAERLVGRAAVPGNRHRPDGTEVTWQQLGVKGLMADPQVPFFVSWDDDAAHPSAEGPAATSLTGMQIAGSRERVRSWLGFNGESATGDDWEDPGVDLQFCAPRGTPGVLSVTFRTPAGEVTV